VPLADESIGEYARQLHATIQRAKQECGATVCLDMTPGRKYMSMITGVTGLQEGSFVRNVYYNHLLDEDYMNKPLPLIPRPLWEVYDIRTFGAILASPSPLPMNGAARSPSAEDLQTHVQAIITDAGSQGISRTKLRKELTRRQQRFTGMLLDQILGHLQATGIVIERNEEGVTTYVAAVSPSTSSGRGHKGSPLSSPATPATGGHGK